MFVKPACHSH